MEKTTALQKPPSWDAPGEPLGPYEEVTLHGHTVGFQAAGEGPLLVLLLRDAAPILGGVDE